MAVHHRVLDGDVGDGRLPELAVELDALPHQFPALRVRAVLLPSAEIQVLRPAVAEVGAGWVGDHQVPAVIEAQQHVLLEMPQAAILGRLEVNGDSIEAESVEGLAHHTGELAGN